MRMSNQTQPVPQARVGTGRARVENLTRAQVCEPRQTGLFPLSIDKARVSRDRGSSIGGEAFNGSSYIGTPNSPDLPVPTRAQASGTQSSISVTRALTRAQPCPGHGLVTTGWPFAGLAYARELQKSDPEIYPCLNHEKARALLQTAADLLDAAQNGEQATSWTLATQLEGNRYDLNNAWKAAHLAPGKQEGRARDILTASQARRNLYGTPSRQPLYGTPNPTPLYGAPRRR